MLVTISCSLYLRQRHIQMEIDITNLLSLSDNINATLRLRICSDIIFLICWIESVDIFLICWIESDDPVADLCLTNQVCTEYILFSAVECFWIEINHWAEKYSPWNAAQRCKLVVWKAAKDGDYAPSWPSWLQNLDTLLEDGKTWLKCG